MDTAEKRAKKRTAKAVLIEAYRCFRTLKATPGCEALVGAMTLDLALKRSLH